jgi:hypothetical protein
MLLFRVRLNDDRLYAFPAMLIVPAWWCKTVVPVPYEGVPALPRVDAVSPMKSKARVISEAAEHSKVADDTTMPS